MAQFSPGKLMIHPIKKLPGILFLEPCDPCPRFTAIFIRHNITDTKRKKRTALLRPGIVYRMCFGRELLEVDLQYVTRQGLVTLHVTPPLVQVLQRPIRIGDQNRQRKSLHTLACMRVQPDEQIVEQQVVIGFIRVEHQDDQHADFGIPEQGGNGGRQTWVAALPRHHLVEILTGNLNDAETETGFLPL